MKWLLLWGLIAPINLLMALDRVAMTLASPKIQAEYNFSFIQTSMIVSCVVWSYAALQIPAGWLVSRFGPRRCLFAACLLWSAATIATPWASSFFGFMVLRLALGAAQAPDWSSSIVSVSNWFTPQQRARANSILLGSLYLGSIIGGPLTTEITSLLYWQDSFYVYGVLGLVLSAAWWLLFRDRPTEEVSAGNDAPTVVSPKLRGRVVMATLLRSPQFWAIGGYYFCVLTIQSFYSVMLPHYLMQVKHISYGSMGWLFGLPWLCLYLAVFLAGFIADRIFKASGSLWLARTPLGMAGCLIAGTAIEVASWCSGTMTVMALFCLSLGALGFSQVSIWSSVQDLTRGYTGAVAGWTTFWGNAASGIAPVVMAVLARWTGSWPDALLLPVLAGVIGTICAAATRPHHVIEMPSPSSPAEDMHMPRIQSTTLTPHAEPRRVH